MTDRLAQIQARADAATKGPWRTGPAQQPQFAGVESHVFSARGTHILLGPTDGNAGQAVNANADFIAHARTDVPALLAMVRERDAALGRVRELAESAPKMQGVGGWSPGIVLASDLLAAITATEGA